ncbi:hypothetical protein EXM22_09580 [Oceanispirochaeta crateris]|uniref:Cytochrome b561 domain-containing protein n=1 Tax=Oceanispirochaeta crateris TaxID=2518645 RepID=A0A5C1QJ90_9SPIO|nr:hypothetical protein [Oceanispirochaeta crateris]QEN08225.1 hypothetical protein EXM22_09580 [Oceanispirochaeta crateris]
MIYEILWRIHAVLMATSLLSMVGAILVSLLWKRKKWRYKTHRALGLYAGAAGITALLTAFVMVQTSHGYHLSSQHAVFGAFSGVLLICTPLLGLNMNRFRNKKIGRTIHKSLGYLTVTGMGISIYYGLSLMGFV